MSELSLRSSDGADFLALVELQANSKGMQFDLLVNSRGFTGRTFYALEAVEFRSLLANLQNMYDSLSGSAELRLHMEESHISFEMKSLGQVLVTGLLVHYQEPAHRLEFGFYSDQSCLPSFIRALSLAGNIIDTSPTAGS